MRRPVEYEETKVRLGRTMSRNAVRQLLTDHAEYGGWGLRRLRRYPDGTRDVWIRRKIIRILPDSDPGPVQIRTSTPDHN